LLVCGVAVEALLLLVLDVHPATTTVTDSSAITRPAMMTRFFSIISHLRCVLYRLVGMKHATPVNDPFFSVDAKCPTLRVEGAFGEWRGSNRRY
jgi:hypothetical protein